MESSRQRLPRDGLVNGLHWMLLQQSLVTHGFGAIDGTGGRHFARF